MKLLVPQFPCSETGEGSGTCLVALLQKDRVHQILRAVLGKDKPSLSGRRSIIKIDVIMTRPHP